MVVLLGHAEESKYISLGVFIGPRAQGLRGKADVVWRRLVLPPRLPLITDETTTVGHPYASLARGGNQTYLLCKVNRSLTFDFTHQ